MRTLFKILLFAFMMMIVIASVLFSSRRLAKVKCGEVTVFIPENSPRYLNEEEIGKIINKNDPELKDKPLYSINTEKIERELGKVSSIKNIEVYRRIKIEQNDFKGKLVVEVEQREPLFRVLTGNDDYYMDREGIKIPGTSVYTAHVLIVTGGVKEEFARDRLLPLIDFIVEDEFWKAQVQQIYVDNNEEVQLIPLVGEQIIEFGDPGEYREKFRNLKALYEQGFAETGWERYSKISLKYKNQVVCTKK